MFQKEVAMRLLAIPNTKSYGRLSVIIQYFFEIKFLFNVFPESFFPVPKVQSSFIQLIPRKNCSCLLKDFRSLSFITKMAFGKRRKMICNSLIDLFDNFSLKKLGISPFSRAENLSVEQYCKLANYVFDHKLI